MGTLIPENFDEPDPRKIEESGQRVTDDEILKNYYLFKKADGLIEIMDKFRKIGTTHLIFTDFSVSPLRTIRIFKEEIIPFFVDTDRSIKSKFSSEFFEYF